MNNEKGVKMLPVEKKYTLEELHIGMEVTKEQLSEIYDTYMIIAYDGGVNTKGKLVFLGKKQDAEYDNWFKQPKPITPIFNDRDELEDMSVYDE